MNRYFVAMTAVAFLGAVALSGVPALAAGPHGPQFPQQVVLTRGQVERVVATLGPVEALSKRYETSDADYSHGDIGASIREALRDSGGLAEFNTIVRGQGFQGFDDWWPVAFSVICAASPEGFEEGDAGMADALAGIQNSTELTPQQKAQYLAQMRQGSAIMEQMRPLPQNVPTVAPYAAEVKRLTQSDD